MANAHSSKGENRMKRFAARHFWWLIPGLLSLALFGNIAYRVVSPSPVSMDAVWAFQPKTIDEAVRGAELIVRARVASVEQGADIVVQLPPPANEEHRTYTQLIGLQVVTTYKGAASPGATVSLFQNGGYNPKLRTYEFFNDDPRYVVGQEYILLMRKGFRGLWIVVSPEGRYLVGPGELAQPVTDNRVTREFRGKSLGIIEPILRRP
jgi:hypothetical protein